MTDERSRWGMLGGIAGSAIGGFTWVVVAGGFLHDPALWGSALVVAAAVVWGGARAALRFPNRPLGVLGAVILAIVLADWLYLALILPRLVTLGPAPWYGMSPQAVAALRPILIAAGSAGTVLVLWDLLRQRDT